MDAVARVHWRTPSGLVPRRAHVARAASRLGGPGLVLASSASLLRGRSVRFWLGVGLVVVASAGVVATRP